MKTFMECVPCLVRQTYEAVSAATKDEVLQENILREALRRIAGIRMDQSPPHMAMTIHRMIRERTGCNDPYREIKSRSNQAAMALYPEMKGRIQASDHPFETAVRLAMAGNVIDFGAPNRPEESELPDVIDGVLSCKLFGEGVARLQSVAESAKTILYLGDNAGEIAFDKLLLEELPSGKTTYAVKGAPVINDVTIDDATETGVTDLVEVIDNGSDAPGTVLESCSPEFADRFEKADVVIAKGQGNYETLSGVPRSNIFFLLKAKCPVIASHIGCNVGDFVIQSTSEEIET